MPIFQDYHRTVIGYHGTRRRTALRLVTGEQAFEHSRQPYDWLGHGVYFWEYAPQQAWAWAKKRYGTEDIAVVASMIRLGSCFDLLDPINAARVRAYFDRMRTEAAFTGSPLPRNFNARKYFDCHVLEYAYEAFEKEEHEIVDTCRGVYVPTGRSKRLWPNSWLSAEAHVQLCVRNPSCVLGTWLVRPRD